MKSYLLKKTKLNDVSVSVKNDDVSDAQFGKTFDFHLLFFSFRFFTFILRLIPKKFSRKRNQNHVYTSIHRDQHPKSLTTNS